MSGLNEEQFVANTTNTSTMGAGSQDLEHLERIPAKFGYSGVLLSIFFFQILNKFVSSYGPPKWCDTDYWKWKNLFISWIHAMIVGTWDISCFVRQGPDMFKDLVEHHTVYSYAMVAFSTGYFIYDFIDIVINKKLMKLWEVVVHHIAVTAMFFYNLVVCRCIAYNCIALLAEVNTFFLHSRKLLQMCKWDFNHWLYRLNALLNLVSFVLCRFMPVFAIMYGIYIWHYRVNWVYLYMLCVSIFIMTGINIVLFWRLLLSDVLRNSKPKVSKSESKRLHDKGSNGFINSNNNIQQNGYVHDHLKVN